MRSVDCLLPSHAENLLSSVYVRPEIRDSLILSIVQLLVEDAATVVSEAAT
jgi:hypothetical protein